MSDSDSSPLSSAGSTDDEMIAASVSRSIGLEKYFKRAKPESPPPPKRPASPPHEYVLADNPDIAFIVMFRERFSDVFPKSLPHYGPQEIERGVTDIVPGDHIERLLCALIGLVLNRKKDVERGHYQRALEEAVNTNSAQWPPSWQGKNPLHGGKNFASMTPEERLGFLKALILWALTSSEAIQNVLKDNYKLTRHDRDRNQPLAVQPWGQDSWKRRYWLIEGRDDTHFRLYRESNPALKTNTWWSVAGTIGEIKSVAETLATEKSRAAKDLSKKIFESIPRFEGSEEKRKRRDYRLARKAAFSRPENGVSLYEGRTRGKRIKYTFSDDEGDFSSDAVPSRKSTRLQSRVSTPVESGGPVYTASGRQVRSRMGGSYGEKMLTGRRAEMGQNGGGEGGELLNGTSRRTRASAGSNAIDQMEDEPDAASSEEDYDAADVEANFGDDDEEMSDAQATETDDMDVNPSLVVHLRYGQGKQIATEGAYQTPPADLKADPITEEKPAPPAAVPQALPQALPQDLPQVPPQVLPTNGSTASFSAEAEKDSRPANMDVDFKGNGQSAPEYNDAPAAPTQAVPLQTAPLEQQDPEIQHNGIA